MRKRLFSIFTSAVMLLTSLLPITANAEEAADIWTEYTFEEFLALSEEEVCAITDSEKFPDGMRLFYTAAKRNNDKILQSGYPEKCQFDIYIKPEINELIEIESEKPWLQSKIDYEVLISELRLPGDFFYNEAIGYDIVFNGVALIYTDASGAENRFSTGYRLHVDKSILSAYEYHESEVVAKIYIWLLINPSIVTAFYDEFIGDASTEPTDEPAVISGDINADGKTGILDVIMLNKYVSQIVGLNDEQLSVADCNGDGGVDSDDLTALMSFLVGLTDTLHFTA